MKQKIEGTIANKPSKKIVNILLVDDDPQLLKVTKQILESENNFKAETASSVEEAIAKLEQALFEVIVSDYEMPIKDGLQFLEELNINGNRTPFILFTGKGREEVAIKALNLGAEGYINKHGNPATVYGELAHCIRQNVEKTRAEKALKESEERLKTIVQNAPIGIATVAADNYITSANDAFCKILGYTENELQKLTFKDLTHPKDIKESITKMEELTTGQIPFFKLEKSYIKKDKTTITGKVVVSVIRSQQGNPCFFIVELEDITDNKKSEEAIRQERDKLNAIAENVGAGIVIVSKDYHILYANKTIKGLRGEVEGKLCYTTLNNRNSICPDCSVQKIFEQNIPRDAHEYLTATRTQNPIWLEIIATPLKDSNGNTTAALEVTIDITEKKQKEKELQESQQKFKSLFIENPAAICYTDKEYHVLEVNAKFAALFGYEPKDILGKNIIQTIVPTEEAQKVIHDVEAITDHAIIYNSRRKRKDGSIINVSISIGPLIIDNKKSGYVVVYNDISDAILAQDAINLILKENIAARKQLAETLKQAELLNDKLDVIGSFTRHDVRNKLTTINGNIYLAKKQTQNNPSLRANLNQIEKASHNIVRILEFSKAYESLGNQALTTTDVGKAIDEATSLFADLHDIKIINQCKNLQVQADHMLTTIFHNLIDNSIRHGEKITQIKIYPTTTPQGNLKIIYEDNGIGIPQNMKNQLFKKGTGKGTGYGLYLFKRTCDIYNWTTQETGQPNKGAKFEFTTPTKNQPPQTT